MGAYGGGTKTTSIETFTVNNERVTFRWVPSAAGEFTISTSQQHPKTRLDGFFDAVVGALRTDYPRMTMFKSTAGNLSATFSLGDDHKLDKPAADVVCTRVKACVPTQATAVEAALGGAPRADFSRQ